MHVTRRMGLWEMGNEVIAGGAAAVCARGPLLALAGAAPRPLPSMLSRSAHARARAHTCMHAAAPPTSCLPAAREVHSNHQRMTANGTALSDSRFWYFIARNAPWSLYNGYKLTLYGLVSSAALNSREAQPRSMHR